MSKSRSRGSTRPFALLLVGAVGALAVAAWRGLTRAEPQHFATPAEQFKYGSIGNVRTQGLPYYVWFVLPRVFGEYLPGNGGYASFGFVSEPGHDVPVGFTRQTVGFPRVAFNCALCHAASYRTGPDAAPAIVPAGPGHTQNTQAYLEFLFACAADPRFSADVLLPHIKQNFDLSFADEQLYRYALIPATRKALLEQKAANGWTKTRPKWGPGRIDPFNPVKYGLLEMKVDDTVGNADNMPIWGLRAREGQRLHWDGMQSSVREVVLTSALGDGATLESLEPEVLARLERWLMDDAEPPPFPGAVDAGLAGRGKAVFERVCHDCHGEGGKRTGGVVPLAEIGTDGRRHELWGKEAADRYNALAEGYPFDFDQWVPTDGPADGYVSTPLTGVWLRGPFLHNGSVPALTDLLAEPYGDDLPAELRALPSDLSTLRPRELRAREGDLRAIERHVKAARAAGRRPAVFFRGYDLVDFEHVGFTSDLGAIAEEPLPFVFDTRLVGNGQGGHAGPRYGTTLPADEKAALVEYLKTL
jgi:mono/diheme cytochrome c family protein